MTDQAKASGCDHAYCDDWNGICAACYAAAIAAEREACARVARSRCRCASVFPGCKACQIETAIRWRGKEDLVPSYPAALCKCGAWQIPENAWSSETQDGSERHGREECRTPAGAKASADSAPVPVAETRPAEEFAALALHGAHECPDGSALNPCVRCIPVARGMRAYASYLPRPAESAAAEPVAAAAASEPLKCEHSDNSGYPNCWFCKKPIDYDFKTRGVDFGGQYTQSLVATVAELRAQVERLTWERDMALAGFKTHEATEKERQEALAAAHAEVARLRGEVERKDAALRAAREKFDDIRGDWSDPRAFVDQGRRIIDAALAPAAPSAEGSGT